MKIIKYHNVQYTLYIMHTGQTLSSFDLVYHMLYYRYLSRSLQRYLGHLQPWKIFVKIKDA